MIKVNWDEPIIFDTTLREGFQTPGGIGASLEERVAIATHIQHYAHWVELGMPANEVDFEIKGLDTQACGGTHLDNTSEAGTIKILKSTKISDSIVRIEFTAGKAAQKELEEKNKILKEAAKTLNVEVNELPSRVQELFDKWKKARKATKKGIKLSKKDLELTKKEKFKGDVLQELSKILKTQPEYVVKTIKRFLKEL